VHGHHGIQLNNLRYNDRGNRLKNIGMALQSKGGAAEVKVEYTHNDVHSVNVFDPILEEFFQAFVTDPDIEQGTTLAELKVLRPSTYANKGFTGKRNARSSQSVISANATHDENMRRVNSRRTQRAPENELEALIESARKGDKTSTPHATGRNSMPAELPEPSSEEYGEDGVYEDD